MRPETLLSAVPFAPVQTVSEIYRIGFDLAQTAVQRYGAPASRSDESFSSVRRVFDVLASRERERADRIAATHVAACGGPPDPAALRWKPNDLVPAEEIAQISNSQISTPYAAWALAVRHRQRAFVFWTYVIALSENPAVRAAAEDMAREALSDGNVLRRERRLAWQAGRKALAREVSSPASQSDEPASAALLESLLLRDIVAWSDGLAPAERLNLLTLAFASPPPHPLVSPPQVAAAPDMGGIDDIKQRALLRAERLTNIYLDDADSAPDQSSMELAQALAARSIMRLAGLRMATSASPAK